MIKITIIKNGEMSNRAVLPAVEAQEWLQQGIEQNIFGLPGEYTVIQEDISAEIEQQKINKEALAYLNSTDWYVIRQLETGVAIPIGILTERANARNRIV